jgi:hypothetical protein
VQPSSCGRWPHPRPLSPLLQGRDHSRSPSRKDKKDKKEKKDKKDRKDYDRRQASPAFPSMSAAVQGFCLAAVQT